jgi:hypothetical protein
MEKISVFVGVLLFGLYTQPALAQPAAAKVNRCEIRGFYTETVDAGGAVTARWISDGYYGFVNSILQIDCSSAPATYTPSTGTFQKHCFLAQPGDCVHLVGVVKSTGSETRCTADPARDPASLFAILGGPGSPYCN